MTNLNQILLEGVLTDHPQKGVALDGKPKCFFQIEVSRERENEIEKCSFGITTFGDLAKNCGEHLVKGREVRVIGRLHQDQWLDASENPHSGVYVVADTVIFKPEGREWQK